LNDAIIIRPLAVDDTAKLAACFERCYGASYVTDTFYDPAAIAARVDAGTLRSVIAVDAGGDVVGHMGLTLRHPRALTADAGNTIVDPRCRNHGLAARLGAGILELCRTSGLVGFHHYATTAHPIMQKLAAIGGGIETGIMLDYIPAGTHYRELAGAAEDARGAAIIIYQPVTAVPSRAVVLPPPYEDVVRAMYERARLERVLDAPAAPLGSAATRVEAFVDAKRGLLRLTVARAGHDLTDRIAEAARREPTAVVQVDLPLAAASTAAAVDALRPAGFFFCAVLPEYLDGDVLRLQRLADPDVARALPELVTAEARELLAFVMRDRTPAPH
jgi:GNAT superfamily N-acetyltransferase